MISVYQSTVKQKCKMRDKPNNVYRLFDAVVNITDQTIEQLTNS
jgi:hypothetical protein